MNQTDFFQLSEASKSILAKSGWFHRRKVDIQPDIQRLSKSGWEIFPIAFKFLESFQDLKYFRHPLISKEVQGFNFNCLEGEDILPFLTSWQDRNGVELYPIGLWSYMYLMIDKIGRIYITDADEKIFLVGASLSESVDGLIFGARYTDLSPL